MNVRNTLLDQRAMSKFALKKVLTITELSEVLQCSLVTVRRRLREWDACTSYNKNGQYYTLRSIADFNRDGIWHYHEAYFSKYGTLKNTVIALAAKSQKGLTHAELQQIIGMNPKCFMARFKELAGITKERHKREIIYFSSDRQAYELQRRNRFPPEPSAGNLPPDAQAIIILVELIHHPQMSIDELAVQLHRKGHSVQAGSIAALFKHHQIKKN